MSDVKKMVSIDVGIKNLAICVFMMRTGADGIIASPEIDKWDVLNLTRKTGTKCCGEDKDRGGECSSEVKYTKNDKYYCLKHSKKETYLTPAADLGEKYLKKQKLQKLIEIAGKYCITYDAPARKAILVTLISEFGSNRCFDAVDKIDANKLDIVTIGRNIHSQIDDMFGGDLSEIGTVIIENQISPIANRMKTIQGMLSQYFLMKNATLNIEFISSINKLKEDGVIHNSYTERKKAGISKCLGMMVDTFSSWENFFSSHKKKDDLADCFLQGMWYVKNRM